MTTEVLHILDMMSQYAVPGAPWLPALVDEAVRQVATLRDRNPGGYAFARRELLKMMADLDASPDPVKLPRAYLRRDPVAILKANVWAGEPNSPAL